jgi:hypothetical protein
MFLMTLSWIFKYTASITKKSDLTVYFGCAFFITNGVVGLCICFFFLFLKSDVCGSWTRCRFKNNQKQVSTSPVRVDDVRQIASSASRQYTLVSTNNETGQRCNRPVVDYSIGKMHPCQPVSSLDATIDPVEGQYVSIAAARQINGGVRNRDHLINTQYRPENMDLKPKSSRV